MVVSPSPGNNENDSSNLCNRHEMVLWARSIRLLAARWTITTQSKSQNGNKRTRSGIECAKRERSNV